MFWRKDSTDLIKKLSFFFNPSCLNKLRIYKPRTQTLSDISKLLLGFYNIYSLSSQEKLVGGGKGKQNMLRVVLLLCSDQFSISHCSLKDEQRKDLWSHERLCDLRTSQGPLCSPPPVKTVGAAQAKKVESIILFYRPGRIKLKRAPRILSYSILLSASLRQSWLNLFLKWTLCKIRIFPQTT